jgi:predicted RNA-binding Zn ribbon-like protein
MPPSRFLSLGGAWILDLLNMGASEHSGGPDALSSEHLWAAWHRKAGSLIELPVSQPKNDQLAALRDSRRQLQEELSPLLRTKATLSDWSDFRARLLSTIQASPILKKNSEIAWRPTSWNCALQLELSLFLSSIPITRLKRCANPRCSHLFFDQSKPGSRRWCDMGSCGNLAKVRRFRKHTK